MRSISNNTLDEIRSVLAVLSQSGNATSTRRADAVRRAQKMLRRLDAIAERSATSGMREKILGLLRRGNPITKKTQG